MRISDWSSDVCSSDLEESVLRAALVEGAAEFVAERMTGSVAYPLLHQWAKGREKELETIFLAEKDQKAIGSGWLYNQTGPGQWAGGLRSWLGFHVATTPYHPGPGQTDAHDEDSGKPTPAATTAT